MLYYPKNWDIVVFNKIVYFCLIIISPVAAKASLFDQDKMLSDLDIIKNTFEVRYAPADWKMSYTNWDLDEQIVLAKMAVLERDHVSIKEYQRIAKKFFGSTKDYHVGISFYSTEEAFLPFRVHGANGKYFVAWVYAPLFAGLKEPLRKGDEVVLFDGKPTHEVIQLLREKEFGNPESETDQALAESTLTMRLGSEGHIVPSGPVTVTVRHAGTNEITTYRLNWFYHPEKITRSHFPFLAPKELSFASGEAHPFFYKDMSTPLYKNYKAALSRRSKRLGTDDDEDEFIGADTSFIPNLGEKVWDSGQDNPFHAYIYLSPEGRKIGYVRIPHYGGGSYSAEKFADVLLEMQATADALVIDQVNNPGGSVFYMYALASMLSDTPLQVPKHEMTITQEDVFFALENEPDLEEVHTDERASEVIGRTLWGYPVTYEVAQSMLKYFRFIIREWHAGRTLTNADYIYGLDYLQPYPTVQFTKPILFLVNQLDFSCGDFMPAILQDNGRATIMGARTAGAGGYVLSHSYPNLFGIESYSFTGSLAQRVNLDPIENLGVTPDIEVELTERDLEFGYRDYVSEIHRAVNGLFE